MNPLQHRYLSIVNIQQLIESINLPRGIQVIGLTTPTGKYQLDFQNKTLQQLTRETDLLGQVFPKLISANPNDLNLSEVTHVGYTPVGRKKAKIVTPKIVCGKLIL